MVRCPKCKNKKYIEIGCTCEPIVDKENAYANIRVKCDECGHYYIINRSYKLIKEEYWCD